MAAYTITYTLRDADANTADMRIGVSAATAFVQVDAFASAIASALSAVSDAVVIRYTIERVYKISAPGGAALTSDVTRSAILVIRLVDDNHIALAIPSIDMALMRTSPATAAGIVLDRDAPAMVAFASLITSTSDDAGVQVTAYVIGGLAR